MVSGEVAGAMVFDDERAAATLAQGTLPLYLVDPAVLVATPRVAATGIRDGRVVSLTARYTIGAKPGIYIETSVAPLEIVGAPDRALLVLALLEDESNLGREAAQQFAMWPEWMTMIHDVVQGYMTLSIDDEPHRFRTAQLRDTTIGHTQLPSSSVLIESRVKSPPFHELGLRRWRAQ